MKIVFVGDSWAWKGITKENNKTFDQFGDSDARLADFWNIEYQLCVGLGKGNLGLLELVQSQNIDPEIPIVWVYTEPGRDYGAVTGRPEFEWMESEDIFAIRKDLDLEILQRIRNSLKNPISLIGGLSDVDQTLAESLGLSVLHPSWQGWIGKTLNSKWFKFGWGAGDIGWRTNYNKVTPSRAAVFEFDELIKEWYWWEEMGYFYQVHPSLRATQEFAEFLQADVINWVQQQYE